MYLADEKYLCIQEWEHLGPSPDHHHPSFVINDGEFYPDCSSSSPHHSIALESQKYTDSLSQNSSHNYKV
jgi:hypothetical protein